MSPNNQVFVDPTTFNPTNLMMIVLVNDFRGGIGWVIKDDTNSNYCHAMMQRKQNMFVSQNLWFHEIPVTDYLVPSNMLKFWSINNLTADEWALINEAITKDLSGSLWSRFYNFPAIVGQALHLPWISMPGQDICSQRDDKYLRLIPRLATVLPVLPPSPADLDNIFNAHPELFTCAGYWWKD